MNFRATEFIKKGLDYLCMVKLVPCRSIANGRQSMLGMHNGMQGIQGCNKHNKTVPWQNQSIEVSITGFFHYFSGSY